MLPFYNHCQYDQANLEIESEVIASMIFNGVPSLFLKWINSSRVGASPVYIGKIILVTVHTSWRVSD